MLFRVVGDNSLGWAEAAVSWGVMIEGIYHRQQDSHHISIALSLPQSTSVAQALCSPSAGESWDGIMLATIQDQSTL